MPSNVLFQKSWRDRGKVKSKEKKVEYVCAQGHLQMLQPDTCITDCGGLESYVGG